MSLSLTRLSEVEGESNEWKKRPSLHTLTLEVIKRETENEAQQDLWATLANRQKNAEPPCCSANPRDWCTPILASFGYLLANFERPVLGCIDSKFCR